MTEPLLAAIAALSNDAIVAKNLEGIVTFWNGAAERMFGYAAAEMLGQSIMRIIPPGQVREEAMILERLRRGELLLPFETERCTKDGRIIPVSVTISPLRDAAGRVVGASKVARDLSETLRISRELEKREALLQSILDTVPEALIVIDAVGKIHSFSRNAEHIFGFTASEVIGRNVSMLMQTADARAHDGHMQRYLRTGERRIIGIGRVVVGRRKDGTAFPMELQVGEVKASGAHLFTGYVRDLTTRQERERRITELQNELIHVSRLSELGQMVSALAHEVNQPMTAIANYAGGIRRLLGPGASPTVATAVDKIVEQATRARGIVQGLLGLMRKEPRPQRMELLLPIIQEIAGIAMIGSDGRISLDLQVPTNAGSAYIDKVQFQQVLLNLMRNSVEAMGQADGMVLQVSAEQREGRIFISVCDTGPGLAPSIRERLFQSFVTTKPDGLGVGLSICQAIVRANGGELELVEHGGTGTCFRFSVPAAPDPSQCKISGEPG